MTVELFPVAPSAIEFLILWLLPLNGLDERDVGPTRDSLDDLPYTMVTTVGGATADKITDHGIYQIEDYVTGVDRKQAFKKAEKQAQLTERRMLALGPPLAPQRPVTMSDGSIAKADSVTTSVKYHWQPYGDNTSLVVRFVARYAVDLRMNT